MKFSAKLTIIRPMPQRLTKFLTLTLLMLGCLSLNVWALPIAAYRERVVRARQAIQSLELPEESLSESENSAQAQNRIKNIRQSLPPGETVQIENQTLEINNGWLTDLLDQFEKEKESAKRRKLLGEISTRLSALETNLVELEAAEKLKSAKSENRAKLEEILNRPEYQKPAPEKDSLSKRIFRQIEEWLRKLFPQPDIKSNSAPSNFSGIGSALQIIIWTVVLGFIGFLLYRFAPVLFQKFKEREGREKKERVILGETILADETAQNIFSEAEELARRGELRAAIRKGYIALLCELSDRKVIGLARHKTNRDYLRDVRARDQLFQKMRGLTADYERHWYGFDRVEKNDWEEFKKQYQAAVSGER